VFIPQIDGNTIDLWLNDPVQFFPRQKALHTRHKFPELALGIRIVEAHHRLEMLNRLKLLQGGAANAL